MAYAHIVMKATSTLKKKWRRVTFSRLLDLAHSSLCLYYDSLWADVEVIGIAMHIPPPFRHNLDQYIKKRSSQIPTQNTGCPKKPLLWIFWEGKVGTQLRSKCKHFSEVLLSCVTTFPLKKLKQSFFGTPRRYPKTSENSASYMNHVQLSSSPLDGNHFESWMTWAIL